MAADVSHFVAKTISLLNLERKAEIEETKSLQENVSPRELQRRGVCLLKLRVRGRRTGLYGRTLLTFEINKPGTDGKLPSHSFTPGKYPEGVYCSCRLKARITLKHRSNFPQICFGVTQWSMVNVTCGFRGVGLGG